jgi:K+/H+ antiporter YhaU regulatory subunit KhtT
MKRAAGTGAMAVSEINLRKTAMRVLGQRLVSTEIHYIQRTLGTSATQQEMDATVIAVRKMPWASIVAPE